MIFWLKLFRDRRTWNVIAGLAGLMTVRVLIDQIDQIYQIDQYPQNVLINVGADLVGAIVTVLAITPIVSRAAASPVRPERATRNAERSVRFLLKIIVRLLPPSERDRYSEEFHAELLDVDPGTRLRHVLSLLGGVFVLRLRRGLRTMRLMPRRGG